MKNKYIVISLSGILLVLLLFLLPSCKLPKTDKCIGLKDVNSRYTPVDLYTVANICVKKHEYEKASELSHLAVIYGIFDTKRVVDKTAHSAFVLAMQLSVKDVTKEEKEKFVQTYKEFNDTKTINKLKSKGYPTYFPKYMIIHGMVAIGKAMNPQDARKNEPEIYKDFNPVSTWNEIFDELEKKLNK